MDLCNIGAPQANDAIDPTKWKVVDRIVENDGRVTLILDAVEADGDPDP